MLKKTLIITLLTISSASAFNQINNCEDAYRMNDKSAHWGINLAKQLAHYIDTNEKYPLFLYINAINSSPFCGQVASANLSTPNKRVVGHYNLNGTFKRTRHWIPSEKSWNMLARKQRTDKLMFILRKCGINQEAHAGNDVILHSGLNPANRCIVKAANPSVVQVFGNLIKWMVK